MNYVCDAFAVLSATENAVINQSKLTSRNAAKEALSYVSTIIICITTNLYVSVRLQDEPFNIPLSDSVDRLCCNWYE